MVFDRTISRFPDDTAPTWEGTVFIHGLYFGHGAEPFSLTASAAALDQPLLKPKPTQAWERFPT